MSGQGHAASKAFQVTTLGSMGSGRSSRARRASRSLGSGPKASRKSSGRAVGDFPFFRPKGIYSIVAIVVVVGEAKGTPPLLTSPKNRHLTS